MFLAYRSLLGGRCCDHRRTWQEAEEQRDGLNFNNLGVGRSRRKSTDPTIYSYTPTRLHIHTLNNTQLLRVINSTQSPGILQYPGRKLLLDFRIRLMGTVGDISGTIQNLPTYQPDSLRRWSLAASKSFRLQLSRVPSEEASAFQMTDKTASTVQANVSARNRSISTIARANDRLSTAFSCCGWQLCGCECGSRRSNRCTMTAGRQNNVAASFTCRRIGGATCPVAQSRSAGW